MKLFLAALCILAAFLIGFEVGKYIEHHRRDHFTIDGPGWHVDYWKPRRD